VISTRGYYGREHSEKKPRARIFPLDSLRADFEVEVLAEVVGFFVQEMAIEDPEEAMGVVVRDPDLNPKGGTLTSQGLVANSSWRSCHI
jgi:hypothetical protein